MQYYQQQGYQPPASYQTNGSPTAPSVLANPNGLPPLQHPGMDSSSSSQSHQSKRKQVKNACTNCQKACKKCDDRRPCPRCVKYGVAMDCVNSVRKERKKGIKRGPYKRREKQEGKSTPTRKSDNGDQQAQYAPPMRAPLSFSAYPSNLHQYGQAYDPYSYGQYYHKDQIMPQSYVYPPMGGLPVLPGQQDGQQHAYHHHQQQQQQQQHQQQQHQQQQHQQQQHQQQHSPMPHHYGGVMNQHSPQTSRPLVHGDEHIHSPQTAQVYYQHNQSQPTSQRSSPHLPEVKAQAVTPIQSTSTSTVTTSSPPESAS